MLEPLWISIKIKQLKDKSLHWVLYTSSLTQASQTINNMLARPPIHQVGSMPTWQVCEVRWASTPHPPTRWAETNYPSLRLSQKPTASARAPFNLGLRQPQWPSIILLSSSCHYFVIVLSLFCYCCMIHLQAGYTSDDKRRSRLAMASWHALPGSI